MAFTSKHRQHLKALAHHLDPLVVIGKSGMSETVIEAVKIALADHELIKVRFGDFKEEKKELATELASKTGSILVNLLGHLAILYRPNPDITQRKIVLPK